MSKTYNPLLEKQIQRFLETGHEDDPEVQQLKEFQKRKIVAESIAEKLLKSLKPKGFYNIPEILDERRIHYAIPNGAFESYPAFDKVYIWQIPDREGDTFTDGGMILMPDQTISYRRNTAPRGVLISAGLKAMDALYSTGIEIGHLIRFKKFAPFILPVEEIDGHPLSVCVMRDGDIEASEDLASKINQKLVEIKNVSDKGYDFRIHENGKASGEKVDAYYDAST